MARLRRAYWLSLAMGSALVMLATLGAADAAAPPPRPSPVHAVPVCPGPVDPGTARCHSRVVDRGGGRFTSTSPIGLSPTTIKSVYDFSTSATAGEGKTIAIVDAFNHPNIEKDLNVFSQQYGLPPCTTANGCFKKVNQSGGTR